jgi:hypothetical protein
MKRVPCPKCRGTRWQPVEVADESNPFTMELCPACRGLGTVYVEVRSSVEALVLPVRLATARVVAVLLTFLG